MHRLLLIGATSAAALVLSGPAAAWSWPADGDVLRPFALGGDAYAAGQHRGIDVAGPAGSSIRAPASGTVSFAGSLPTYGRSLTILTADGYAVTLVHLGTVEVAKGDAVEEGASVATMGSSGEPEHSVASVHLGVRVASQEAGYVDPLGLLPPRATTPRPTAPAAPAPSPVPATPQVPSAAAASPLQPAAPAPAPASAPAASGASGSPSQPVTTAQAAGGAQTASSPSAPSSAPGAPAPSEPVGRVSGPASSASGTASTAAAQAPATSTVEQSGEFVVSTPAQRVGEAVAVRHASHAAATAARTAEPDIGAPAAHAVSDRGARTHHRATRSDTRAERTVSENAAAPDTARPQTRVAAVVHRRGGRAGVAETAATGRRTPPERPATFEPTGRASRTDALPSVTAHERATARPERRVGGPSRAVLAALALLVLLAGGIATKAARRIAGDGPVLRHHADLLRELHAPHRPRVHDRGRGRLHAPSAATRS